MFRKLVSYFYNLLMLGTDTTTTTMTEAIPTIVGAALIELVEGDVIGPLITNIDFPGPGIVHQTPKIAKLTAEADDSSTAQAVDSGGYTNEGSPSAATVGVHNASVLLKDIASLGTVGDLAAIAGQLIGECLVVRKDLDLVTLFSTFSTNQGCTTTTTAYLAPADLYDAYGSLRGAYAPLPYNLVLPPTLIWSNKGLITLFDNSADAVGSAFGVGTVAEDWARNGFSGMVMGFSLYSDGNISISTTNNGVGAAFSRAAIKNVIKRGFQVEVMRDISEVGTEIVGTEIRGEALMRVTHGNIMTFTTT
jgi:hypothetical protein